MTHATPQRPAGDGRALPSRRYVVSVTVTGAHSLNTRTELRDCLDEYAKAMAVAGGSASYQLDDIDALLDTLEDS